MNQKNALFGGLDTGPSISDLPIEDVRPDPKQPRKTFAEDALKDLAHSIEQHGLVQPIIVRRDPENHGKFLITAGERRYRAVRNLKQPTIAAIIRDETNAAAVAIVENLQRVDLSPIEEAEAVARLLDEQGLSQGAASKLLGKSRTALNQLLRINALPAAIRAEAATKDVPKSILVELAQLGDEAVQKKLWKRALTDNLTVADIRRTKGTAADRTDRPTDNATTGVRRRTPVETALEHIRKGVIGLEAQPMTEEERATVHELINKLNALTAISGTPPAVSE